VSGAEESPEGRECGGITGPEGRECGGITGADGRERGELTDAEGHERGEPTRRERGLKRLAELGDEPGGEAFLARMGVLGDWVVDFAFGDVHTRPTLTARERELIIVAVLTTLGSSDPQVAAHVRALRAIDVPWEEIEETILQTAPYAGVPRAINAMKVLRAEQEAQ
jgi:4-carboxymuconolactone decarboxylase